MNYCGFEADCCCEFVKQCCECEIKKKHIVDFILLYALEHLFQLLRYINVFAFCWSCRMLLCSPVNKIIVSKVDLISKELHFSSLKPIINNDE